MRSKFDNVVPTILPDPDAGEDNELPARYVDINILEVVLACSANSNKPGR